MGYTEGML